MNTILPYTKRQALVQVFTQVPLDESCAYPVEFMHALRNHISHSVGYSLFGKKKYCESPYDSINLFTIFLMETNFMMILHIYFNMFLIISRRVLKNLMKNLDLVTGWK